MGVKILNKQKGKIQLEIDENFTIKDILKLFELAEIDEILSKKGLSEEDSGMMAEEINKNWWDKNKEWFLKE
jgi:hypothetical protein